MIWTRILSAICLCFLFGVSIMHIGSLGVILTKTSMPRLDLDGTSPRVLVNAWSTYTGTFASIPRILGKETDSLNFPAICNVDGKHCLVLGSFGDGSNHALRIVEGNNVLTIEATPLLKSIREVWPLEFRRSIKISDSGIDAVANFALHDWGIVPPNTLLETEFLFRNCGNDPIALANFSASCSCVILPDLESTHIVSAGDEFKVPVKLRFGQAPHVCQQFVFEISSGEKRLLFAPTLIASSIPRVTANLGRLDFGVHQNLNDISAMSFRLLQDASVTQAEILSEDFISHGPVEFEHTVQLITSDAFKKIYNVTCRPIRCTGMGELNGEITNDKLDLSVHYRISYGL